jgi:uncharacterized protein YjbI with pentapeptide repeats
VKKTLSENDGPRRRRVVHFELPGHQEDCNFNELGTTSASQATAESGWNQPFLHLFEVQNRHTMIAWSRLNDEQLHSAMSIFPKVFNLVDANLSGVNFSGVNLSGHHFKNADLSNADLSNADLSYANLTNCNLANANLSGANLAGTCCQFQFSTLIIYVRR